MYSVYCKHGTNIGNPYGPDLICGPCEDGEPARSATISADALQALMPAWKLTNAGTVLTSPDNTGVRVACLRNGATVVEWTDVDADATRQSVTLASGTTYGATRAIALALDELIRRRQD